MNHILRFITGALGGEFPLERIENSLSVGSEFDMVLDDDLVSRRHAHYDLRWKSHSL